MALVRVVSSCLQRLVPTSKRSCAIVTVNFPFERISDAVGGVPVSVASRLISSGLRPRKSGVALPAHIPRTGAPPSSCQTGFRTSQLNTLQLYPFLWSSVNDRTRLLDDLFQPIIVLRRFDDYGYCCGHLARPWCQRTHHRHRRLDHDYPSFVLPGALVRPHPLGAR